MISPGNSPHLIRRSTTPISGGGPPPLPPRKNSPTFEQNALSSDAAAELSYIAKSSSMQDICSDNGGNWFIIRVGT